MSDDEADLKHTMMQLNHQQKPIRNTRHRRNNVAYRGSVFENVLGTFSSLQAWLKVDDVDEDDEQAPDCLLALVQAKPPTPIEDILARLEEYPEEASIREHKTGRVPLHYAPSKEVVEALLEVYREACETTDVHGSIPLHMAVNYQVQMELLHAYPGGAKVKDDVGALPLHAAVAKSRPVDMIEALVYAFPDAVREPDLQGRLPIRIAVEKKLLRPWIDLLLKAHTETAIIAIDAAAGHGTYAYQMAAWCVEHVVSELLEIFLKDGAAALELAVLTFRAAKGAAGRAESTNTEIAELLMEASERLQLYVSGLLEQLSKAELEGLLSSPSGTIALKHATDAVAKRLLGRPRVQTFLQQRLNGALLTFVLHPTYAWIEFSNTRSGVHFSLRKSRAFQLVLLALNFILVHPIFLIAMSIYPPLVGKLEELVPEVKVLPKEGELHWGAYLLFRVPSVKALSGMVTTMALATQLSHREIHEGDVLADAECFTCGMGWWRHIFWMWRLLVSSLWTNELVILWIVDCGLREARQLFGGAVGVHDKAKKVLELPAIVISLLSLCAIEFGVGDPMLAKDGIAVGVLMLWTSQLLRLLMINETLGPFILMIFKMASDVGKWLVILSCVLAPTAIGLYIIYADDGELSMSDFEPLADDQAAECVVLVSGMTSSAAETMLMLVQRIFGGAEVLLVCVQRSRHPLFGSLLVLYYVIATITLLVNLLIAVMARTFDIIYESATLNYQHQVAVVVLEELDASPIPPPLNLLSTPYYSIRWVAAKVPHVITFLQTLCTRGGRASETEDRGSRVGGLFQNAINRVRNAARLARKDTATSGETDVMKQRSVYTSRLSRLNLNVLAGRVEAFVDDHLGEELSEQGQRTKMQKMVLMGHKKSENLETKFLTLQGRINRLADIERHTSRLVRQIASKQGITDPDAGWQEQWDEDEDANLQESFTGSNLGSFKQGQQRGNVLPANPDSFAKRVSRNADKAAKARASATNNHRGSVAWFSLMSQRKKGGTATPPLARLEA